MELHSLHLRSACPADYPTLLGMSADWESENSCYGYRQNTSEDLAGRRILVAESGSMLVGYLFGCLQSANRMASIMPDGTQYFEIDELYVRPDYRSRGVGRALVAQLEQSLREEGVTCTMLATATKDCARIMHFYLDELGMQLWSARLFKDLSKTE